MLEAQEIDLAHDSPFQRIFLRLVKLWQFRDASVIPATFSANVVCESPAEGVEFTGIDRLVQSYEQVFKAGGELRTARAFDDGDSPWLVYEVSFARLNKSWRCAAQATVSDDRVTKFIGHTLGWTDGLEVQQATSEKSWSALPVVGRERSTSGMRWFYTPEEYLAYYRGYSERDAEVPTPSSCPRCNGRKIERKIPSQGERRRVRRKLHLTTAQADDIREIWLCQATLCTWGGILTRYSDQKVRAPISRQDYVFWVINNTINSRKQLLSVGILPRGAPAPTLPGPGLIGTIAQLEMFSSNPETARTGMAFTALNTYQQHQKEQQAQQVIAAAWSEFAAEAQHAWNLAVDFFNREQWTQAQAAASVAEEERLKFLAREMAKEMVAEARRQSGGYDAAGPPSEETDHRPGSSRPGLAPGQ